MATRERVHTATYTHQALIKEYKHKFTCLEEDCPLYPCYAQWFCEGLSLEGRAFLGIEGACVVKEIERICEVNGKKRTRWETVLLELGEERDTEDDIKLDEAGGIISSLKRSLREVERNNNGLSP